MCNVLYNFFFFFKKKTYILHQTLLLVRWILLGSILLAFNKLGFIRQTKHDSSVHRTRFHYYRVQRRCFAPLQLTLGTAPSDLRRVCSCSAMEANFVKYLRHSSCVHDASRGRLEISFHSLPLNGWLLVSPRPFHFTIIDSNCSWTGQF